MERHSIDRIFWDAAQIASPAEREAYLRRVCADDAALRGKVEQLLAAQSKAEHFLESPASDLAGTVDAALSECPGTVIGSYKLLEQIGEGGFGVVFMAEQSQPIRRKVALKVLKPGMDTRQVVARFEAERQALALMDHPNIARVFDGGATTAGRPYFVMELVRGVPITTFCDQNHLPIRERLSLFLSVCKAVQHAHQKGIIHRDLKPTNIMVALHDATPVAKVIDFGIAKATGQQLTDKTLFTNFAQLIGTPLYMSPEQAQMSGLDIDTRTDIYALGVLLYELLTGTTPFDRERLKLVSIDEVRRIIREEEPAKPSTRIRTLRQAATTISTQRNSDPKRLSQLIRGELDWIVIKALEKERNRRYESASAFAADVQRYLRDEPVLACPPSARYRFRKFVRRRKGPVLAASLVVLALLGGIIGTTWGMLRATDAKADAVSETKLKEAALTDAEDQLFHSLVQQARAERSSDRIGQRFLALEAIRTAAKIRVTPELRTEAIAALVLPDIEMVHEWAGWPEDSLQVDFDAKFQRYSRMDRQGGVTVCRLSNDQEEVIARLPTQVKPPFGLIWMSPDGRYLAYGEESRGGLGSKRVWVWKLDGSSPKALLEVLEGVIEGALAFHDNGRHLAIGHADNTVSIYDLAAAKRVQQLAVGSWPINLAFHPHDGRLAVVCGGAVKLFDVDTAKELPALRPSNATIRALSVAWHPDGRRLAVGCGDQKIRMWDTQTGAELMAPWQGPGRYILFNHAGDRLVSGDWGRSPVLWDATTGRQLLALPGHSGRFSADDRLFGHTISGNKIRFWRLAGGQELRELRCRNAGNLESTGSPVVDPSGRILAASTRRCLCFFDLESGEELASVWQPRMDACSPVFFDPPRAPLSPEERGKSPELGGWVTGGQSALFLWPARSDPARPGTVRIGPRRQIAPDGGAGYSTGASTSSDGRVVAVPQGNSTLVVHRDQPERRLSLGPQHDVRFAAVSPDGHWVVTCSWWWDGRSQTGVIWEAKTGKRVHDLLQNDTAGAKFSPDGQWLATSDSGSSRLWEVGTWREVWRFQTASMAFSPDSRLLAINDELAVIRLIETNTGREVARLTGPDSVWYQPLCFTPDGTRLISSGNKGLCVWDLRLIRQELKEFDLDWHWPEFPPAVLGAGAAKPLKVEILLGDLNGPTVTHEQRSRRFIDHYRAKLAAELDDADICNGLAWVYATAPKPLRDVKAALPLAEKAVRLDPRSAMYRNTLGVVYYRAGRFREAVETLRPNLEIQEDGGLAFDLYFLAMSHQRLGETARARDYYDWAIRWVRTQNGLSAGHLEELKMFRAEAEELLAIKPKQEKNE
jgi:serine/threonine protein kinase/WD40 repeat protein